MRSTNISVTPINMEYSISNSIRTPTPTPPNAASSNHQLIKNDLNRVISEQSVGVITTTKRGEELVDSIGGAVDTSRTKSAPHLAIIVNSSCNEDGDIDDGADAELARIDFQAVNMRSKKNNQEEFIRPMSWEGELSDGYGDGDGMYIDESSELEQLPKNLSVATLKQNSKNDLLDSPTLRLKQPNVSSYSLHSTPSNSPLLNQRHTLSGLGILGHKEFLQKNSNVPPTPSPDSAIHSAYSVLSSPNQSPLTQRHISVTPNLSRNNSDASHSSCCSYSSVSISVSPTQQFSPTHSPIQGRHVHNSHHNSPLHHGTLFRSLPEDQSSVQQQYEHEASGSSGGGGGGSAVCDEIDDKTGLLQTSLPSQSSISRQQLINSPCPICNDKISGFHYGIFSCESCKGFFKRTVQNRKNYVCLRGAQCPVTVTTRKKCPACRFEKCLQCGMKLEAIREDRTRGGRSTYQCSYSIPPSLTTQTELRGSTPDLRQSLTDHQANITVKLEPLDNLLSHQKILPGSKGVSPLLQEIMDVEHLWQYNELELNKLNSNESYFGKEGRSDRGSVPNLSSHPLLAGTALAGSTNTNPDFVVNLCNIADHRLYKIVKWCKSLPLFKNISIDDQISLLINSWCELLLFSCCFRSVSTPGEIRVSLGKCISLAQARDMGMQTCIERMLNFTEHLRRLKVDKYEYVAMKVIVLLTSDTSELREAEKVRASQEKALQALQDYTISHYPESPAKFGELLLRIPELQRTCQVGKELLTVKSKDGDGPSFNLLMELLRGDH